MVVEVLEKDVKQKQIIRKARDHVFGCKYLKLNA